MWRWSSTKCSAWFKLWVFSTYVEVIPCIVFLKPVNCRILHVCGGDPTCPKDCGNFFEYSPRMWRWSYLVASHPWWPPSILHVCGGDPTPPVTLLIRSGYSPRMWRWSYWYFLWVMVTGVFSTYVEVIPRLWSNGSWSSCILHVCGGDPHTRLSMSSVCQYSPRMWRWSRPCRILHQL